MATTMKQFRLPAQTIEQLRQLVDGGWMTTDTAAVTTAIDLLWQQKQAQAKEALPPKPAGDEVDMT